MKRFLFVIILLLSVFQALTAQTLYGEYRSESNKSYWKNRKPHAGYWQQDVHYEISAELDPEHNSIKSNNYRLMYWNNSPYTLQEAYFHVYQNAFIPGSYYEQLWMDNGKKVKFGPLEKTGKGTLVEGVHVDGIPVKVQPANTVFKIELPKPLHPGDSTVITMQFTTWFDNGDMRRRMKVIEEDGHKTFGAVFWYPAICVYDQKFGWNTDQHLDKEFYNNFGSFDVRLKMPWHYTAEATGLLKNVPLTEEELAKTRIPYIQDSLKTKSKTIKVPYLDPRDALREWHWQAINVHNFAFTAGPLFTRADTTYHGIQIVALARPETQGTWRQALPFVMDIIESGEKYFGPYLWPKIVIADVQDGMEYPMITFVGGNYPANKGLLTHEIGHMWFYGMVGSNETYRAAMDEGFTQFFTAIVMEDISRQKRGFFIHKDFGFPVNYQYTDAYYGYLSMRKSGLDARLNTHSSDFNEGIRQEGGYGQVYFKTATMLYNLKYVLGDTVFWDAMKYYFDQWNHCQPYLEDFRQAIISHTRVDLNWFFDQWLETTKFTDYGLVKGGYDPLRKKYQVLIKRYGAMQMPLDLSAVNTSNGVIKIHVPNTWYKKPDAGILMPQWYGWGKFNKYYLLEFESVLPIKYVVLDPSFSLADIDMSDNLLAMPTEGSYSILELPKQLNRSRELKDEKRKQKIYGNKKSRK